MPSMNLEPRAVRRFVKGTMLERLYTLIYASVKDDYTDSYFAEEFTAGIIAHIFNEYQTHHTIDAIPRLSALKGETHK